MLIIIKFIINFLNRYRREKSRLDLKDKYSHNEYSRTDDNRKNYDHKRDFKRNVGILKKNKMFHSIYYVYFNRILVAMLKSQLMIVMNTKEMIEKNHFQKLLSIILEIL